MRHALILALAATTAGLAGCSTTGMFKEQTPIVASSRCAPTRFEIYFADSAATLTQPAQQAIALTARKLEPCQIKSVRVIGLADARGSAEANQTLSQRRADTVAKALAGAGWPAPAFDVTAEGDTGAANEAGIREPLRRRTEVLIDAAPRT